MDRIPFLLVLLLLTSCSKSEEPRQVSEEITYRTAGAPWQNYYLTVVPSGEIRGLIVLLPGFGTAPERFLYEIKLDSIAPQLGLMVLVPSPQGWGTHYLDDASIDTLHVMIQEVTREHKLAGKKFVIGGFSIGGTGALRFAEQVLEGRFATYMTLAGAFAVDSPLDFERLWFSFEREVQRGRSQEAEHFLNALRDALGGSPEHHVQQYLRHSPFLASWKDGGEARFLKDIPLRLSVEPDSLWWKANGWLEYQHQNAHDLDRVFRLLRDLGNERVELIKTTDRGYRKDGRRHPHSWSIVDERELLDWALKTMGRR